jgi:minor extracellular serine protease Vpr
MAQRASLGILDLTDDSGSSAPANPYRLGTLYTRQQIDNALRYSTNLVIRDAVGHGTTTTSIACGNGRNLPKYRGAAPEATILTVKIVAENVPAHDNQPAELAFYDPKRIPVAINYIADQQRQLGMPCVMLLNLGSSGGPMDGTSAICQTLNSAVGPGIPGLIFVTGASDDGGMANHASGKLTAGAGATIVVHKGDAGTLAFDLWYSSADRFDVSIQTPSKGYGPYAAPNADSGYDTQSTSDFLYYQLGGTANFYNTSRPEREIWARLLGPIGNYSITLKGQTVVDGRFNASINPSQFWNASANSNYFTTYVSPGGTVWDLASASNNICPNDYVHRTQWVDIDGVARSNSGQGNLGELWTGSGTGPTYDGRYAVDVSAPGDSVFTCYNPKSYWATARGNLIQDGSGLYGRAGAVSAASPIVTGIIALMLQMNPTLDAPTVKSILQGSARTDSFTGPVPNTRWGYGKADAYAAVAKVQAGLPRLSLYLLSNQPAQLA